jgi:hypothetical protein
MSERNRASLPLPKRTNGQRWTPNDIDVVLYGPRDGDGHLPDEVETYLWLGQEADFVNRPPSFWSPEKLAEVKRRYYAVLADYVRIHK